MLAAVVVPRSSLLVKTIPPRTSVVYSRANSIITSSCPRSFQLSNRNTYSRFLHTSKSTQFIASNMAEQENRAAWLTSAGGPIEVGPAPLWEPEKGQIRVKVFAAPLTPADALFSSANPPFKFEYPLIIYSTVAGMVDAVGEGVTKVVVGDRVTSGTKIWTSRGESKYGGVKGPRLSRRKRLLRYLDAETNQQIGDTPYFDAITSGIQTAAGGLFAQSALNMDRPTNPTHPVPNGKKILIWGGASAMGALSISHAHAAGYTVITTCSPHNFDLVKSRGAEHVFDYHAAEETVAQIESLFPIDYFYDSVSLPSSMAAMSQIAEAAIAQGHKDEVVIQSLVPASMFGNPALPQGVTTQMLMFRNATTENKDLVAWMLKQGGYLERGLKEGWLRGVEGESVGGLGQVEKGLKRRKIEKLGGVSARRLIVEPWKE